MSHNGVVWKDLLHGIRALRRSPVFTTAAVLSLALGIGANTAIFSLLDQVVFRSLPIAGPERLVAVHGSYSGPGESSSSWSTNSESVFPYPLYRDLRDRDPAFVGILACAIAPVRIAWRSSTQAAQAEIVTGNYFTTLGAGAALGRVIAPPDDGAPGANPVAVLSHGFWATRLGADAAIVGQTVAINGQPFVAIGVAAADFNGLVQGDSPDLFVPLAMQRAITPTMNSIEDRTFSWLTIFARLKPGGNHAKAQAATAIEVHALRPADVNQGGAAPGAAPKPPRIASRRARHHRTAGKVGKTAHRADDHGRAGASDRLCQRGRPAGGARCRASAGNRHPAGFGSETLGAGEAVAHRGRAAGRRGGGSRPAVGTLVHRRVAAHSAAGCRRGLGDEFARPAGARLLTGSIDAVRAALRPGPRPSGDPAKCSQYLERPGLQRPFPRPFGALAAHAGNGPGGALSPAGGRRRAFQRQCRQPDPR